MDYQLAPATLQQLQIFFTMAEQLSVPQTAQELLLDQDKVIKELKKLEEILAFPLFEYQSPPMRLTPMGSVCYQSWLHILTTIEHGFSRALSQCDTDTDTLCIGTAYGINYESMHMTLIDQFQIRYPDITLTLREDGMYKLEELLAKRELDMVIMPDSAIYGLSNHIYEWTYLVKKPLSILVANHSPLAQCPSVHIADILHIPLICFDPTINPSTLTFLRKLYGPYGKVPAIISYYSSNYEITELLEESGGICIVGSYFPDTLVKGCTRVPIADQSGGLMAIWNKNQGKRNVENFLQLSEELKPVE